MRLRSKAETSVFDHPFVAGILVIAFLIAIYLLTFLPGIIEQFGKDYPSFQPICSTLLYPEHFFAEPRHSTIHLVNVFALIGLVFTCIGVYITYHQVQLTEGQIDGYRSFCRWVLLALKEIPKEHLRKLYFSASTIIPGNLAYTKAVELEQFTDEISMIKNMSLPYNSLRRTMFILPSRESYVATYSCYETRCIEEVKKASDSKYWTDIVTNARKEAEEEHQQLATSKLVMHDSTSLVELTPANTEFSWLMNA